MLIGEGKIVPEGADMEALIETARLGWGHLTIVDREWLAERCGPELHEVLSRDHAGEVRHTVARRCGFEFFDTLSRDPEGWVREVPGMKEVTEMILSMTSFRPEARPCLPEIAAFLEGNRGHGEMEAQ